MSSLPNSAIRLIPPSFRDNYCPESWTTFARDIVAGTSAQPALRKGLTFYNFGSTAPYPPAPTPEPPTPSCVDFGIDWEPAAFDLDKYISAYVASPFPSLDGETTLSFEATEYIRDTATFDLFQIWDNTTVTSISFPNCTTLGNSIFVRNLSALTSFSMPVLTTIQNVNFGGLTVDQCPNLSTLDLASLVTVDDSIDFSDCPSLTTFNATGFVPRNGITIDFENCGLLQASVDLVLARCVANAAYVSGTVDLSGGTNATPSVAGLADKATLIGRGVVVNTN